MSSVKSNAVIWQNDLQNLQAKIKSKQRQLEAVITVKDYKDPADKLIKAQDYFKNQLKDRPMVIDKRKSTLESKKSIIEAKKERLEEEVNSNESDIASKIQVLEQEVEEKIEALKKALKIKVEALETTSRIKNKDTRRKIETLDKEIDTIDNEILNIYDTDSETIRLREEIRNYDTKIFEVREHNKSKTHLVLEAELKAYEAEEKEIRKSIREAEEAERFLNNEYNNIKESKGMFNKNQNHWTIYMDLEEEDKKKNKNKKPPTRNTDGMTTEELNWEKERLRLKAIADKETEEEKLSVEALLKRKREQEYDEWQAAIKKAEEEEAEYNESQNTFKNIEADTFEPPNGILVT